MTGKEKIEAAFSTQGTPEIPAVICYERILIRDHWEQVSRHPWWYLETPDVEQQLQWRREAIQKIGQDWFILPFSLPAEERRFTTLEVRPDGVYRVDLRTGSAERMARPRIGGWSEKDETQSASTGRARTTMNWMTAGKKSDAEETLSVSNGQLPETSEEIDVVVPISPSHDPRTVVTTGVRDLADCLLTEFGADICSICYVDSPIWGLYDLWGFEGMMIMVATSPGLVRHACERLLELRLREVREAAVLGADVIWITEALTDMISPNAFERLNVPYIRVLCEEIRALGMKSIYGYCGNPHGKWDNILAVGADALALEESKKNFSIEIEDVVDRVHGQCTVLGNLDAIGVLQDASDNELRAEIARQIAAGRRNHGRFIMSPGSPVTPGTTLARVRLFCDLVHDLGRI